MTSPRSELRWSMTLLAAALPLTAQAHGDLHERISAATEAIERNSTNARYFLARAELHREHRDWVAAKADLQRAEKLDPHLAAIPLHWALLLDDAGEWEAAQKRFDEYLAREPHDGHARVARARAWARSGERRRSIQEFTRALTELREPQPDIFLERARLQVQEGQTQAALRGLDEGMRALGQIVALQAYALDLELSEKNYDAALARVDSILDQSARKEQWLVRRGDVLRLAGKDEAARESYRSAIEAVRALPSRLQQSEPVIEIVGRATRGLDELAAPQQTGEDAPARSAY